MNAEAKGWLPSRQRRLAKMKISQIHIETLKAAGIAMRGCDPTKELTAQQIFNVVAAYRDVLNAFEKEAAAEVLREKEATV
jgi:hypothetical protein